MNTKRAFLRLLTAAPLATAMAFGSVPASNAEEMRVAQADCYSVGQQVAAQNGGTLARAQMVEQGGQQVCVVVVLMPARDGQRPRRQEFTVPAN